MAKRRFEPNPPGLEEAERWIQEALQTGACANCSILLPPNYLLPLYINYRQHSEGDDPNLELLHIRRVS